MYLCLFFNNLYCFFSGKMDLFADIIGDEATPEDYNSIAVYFESERNSLQAGRFFHKAGHHSKALRHLLKSAASSNDDADALNLGTCYFYYFF